MGAFAARKTGSSALGENHSPEFSMSKEERGSPVVIHLGECSDHQLRQAAGSAPMPAPVMSCNA